MTNRPDRIPPERAGTLDRMFHERARRSPQRTAYRHFDERSGVWRDITWSQMVDAISRWQAALASEGLPPGARVAIMLKNSPDWIAFDQAALGLGLVTVPLYTADRPDNVAYVLRDSGASLLLVDSAERWQAIRAGAADLPQLRRVIAVKPPADAEERLRALDAWLPAAAGEFRHRNPDGDALASIIYTSGTTGQPKGVMLTHRNMLHNCHGVLHSFDIYQDDRLLSFLPLSHTFERTAGYYLAVMAGATVVFARSFQQLQEDLALAQPTILMSVPRIYERVYAALRDKLAHQPVARRLFELTVAVGYSRFEHRQGRGPWRPAHLLWPLLKRLVADRITARLGGRIRIAVSGGAALPPPVARVFIGLGLTLLQGYGLTETSPVISVNRPQDNLPASVGTPLQGVEIRVADSGELQVRGASVMLGYWNDPAATRAVLAEDGWLGTGDVVRVDADGHIFITGRIKDIIVLSNGEKISPADMESALLEDPLFEQVMVVGEGRPYLALLAVVTEARWAEAGHDIAGSWPAVLQLPQARSFALRRAAQRIRHFPGYARLHRIALTEEAWTLENGLLTPTLKLKRGQVLESMRREVEEMYAGFGN